MFGVNPELIDQHNQTGNPELLWTDTHDCHRQVKHAADKRHCALLAQGGGEIEFLALMMHRMGGPAQRVFVTEAMQPVVKEIKQDYRRYPAQRSTPKSQIGKQRHAFVDHCIDADLKQLRHQCDQLTDQPLVQATDGIAEPVGIAAREIAIGKLHAHENEEHRDDVDNDLFHDANARVKTAWRVRAGSTTL